MEGRIGGVELDGLVVVDVRSREVLLLVSLVSEILLCYCLEKMI